jgi:acyl CoA:acetate/3-ketoacid CoA transferase beta subunit
MTMSDTPNIPGALWSTGTLEITSLLRQGLAGLAFIGGAEIDKHGNLNTNYVGDWRRLIVRLPGSGGGPAAVITTLGVYRFDPKPGEMVLASWHPGQSVQAVRAATGWDLRLADGCRETPTPTAAELEIVRACDPAGFWTR